MLHLNDIMHSGNDDYNQKKKLPVRLPGLLLVVYSNLLLNLAFLARSAIKYHFFVLLLKHTGAEDLGTYEQTKNRETKKNGKSKILPFNFFFLN